MTTLSKEDVVKAFNAYCKRKGIRANSQYAVEDGMPWFDVGYNAARADLVAENERLKEENTAFRKAWNADQLFVELRTALAAAEAREIAAINCIDELIGLLVRPFCDSASAKRAAALINTPRDDSALREMIAEVYEECAKVCEAMNYINTQPHHCADAIRALAEKAKGE